MNPIVIKSLAMIIGGGIVTGLALESAKNTINEGRAEREKINKNTKITIDAMQCATSVMKDRIKQGKYAYQPISKVIDDWEFEVIVQAYDK